jgi:hypothetical protein
MTDGGMSLPTVMAVVVGTMVTILWLAARVSGWTQLASRFRWEGPAEGPRFTWVSVGFGPLMWYNHCLTVTASGGGLSLRMQHVMRIFHPSLLIPWDHIAGAEPWGGMLLRGVVLHLAGGGRVIFKRGAYERMQAAFPERLRVG